MLVAGPADPFNKSSIQQLRLCDLRTRLSRFPKGLSRPLLKFSGGSGRLV